MIAVQFREGGVTAVAEEAEECLERETADAGDLEFEEGVLSEVEIDGVNLVGRIEDVVEGVATGRGNEDDAAFRVQAHDLAIDPWILPAGVIDEVVSVDVGEQPVGGPAGQGFHRDE
jgi:hypothetical protein